MCYVCKASAIVDGDINDENLLNNGVFSIAAVISAGVGDENERVRLGTALSNLIADVSTKIGAKPKVGDLSTSREAVTAALLDKIEADRLVALNLQAGREGH